MPFWNVLSRKRASELSSDLSAREDDATQSTYPSDNYGLETVVDKDEAIVDIVFVHGLTGNQRSTWTSSTSIFWPQDLLADDLPSARIMTFWYDADIVALLNIAGSNTIRDNGKSLAQDLAIFRIRTNSADRPIIFVVHSLGGLVVEQALLIARGSSEVHVKALLPATAAITFLGTPHMGSTIADWAAPLTRLGNMVRRSNSDIVAVLRPGSEMLATIQQEFHTMLEDRKRNQGKWISIYCFYEEKAYSGVGHIVPRHSAILANYPNACIHQNHSEMTKFRDNQDSGYKRVRDQLWLWINNLDKDGRNNCANPAQSESSSSEQHLQSEQSHGHGPETSQNLEQSESQSRSQGIRPSVSSGGGAVFMGNVSAGRDFNYR